MRSLMSLSVVACLLVVEVLSDGTRSLGAGGLRGLVWGRAAGEGAVCWGPGVWPHPSHCRMFSVCHVANESAISGMLLMCPQKMAFSTRRGRCLNDRQNRCSEKPLPKEILNSTEVYHLSSATQRNYRCRSPKPFCRNEQTLTVCAPNFSLIGNVSCSGGCRQENGVAVCYSDYGETERISSTTESVPLTSAVFESTRLATTTPKYGPPVLNADLIDSTIKITSSLGLDPSGLAQQNLSNTATSKPIKHESKPGTPAYTAPVFDFSSPSKEESSESGQSAEGGNAQFSKPVVVEPSKHSTTKKPEGSGNEDSQIFTVEMVKPGVDGVTTYRPAISSTEKMKVGEGNEEKIKQEKEKIKQEEEKKKMEEMERLERERLEKEKLEKERLEKERLEKERLEKERLEKEKLEREKLEKEKLEKERLEKERLEKEKLEKERLEKEKLEKERLEKERLEKERLEKEKLEKLKLEKEKLEKERLEKERLEKERLENERLEKEELEKQRLEEERLQKEKLEKERLEKERIEKERLEMEQLENERYEKERLEKERLEKEKLEKEESEKRQQERLEQERLELEKQDAERLELQKQEEMEKWQKENEKYSDDLEKLVVEQSTAGGIQLLDTSYFSGICSQPGLVCANSNTLVECSPGRVPVRAWDCGAFFARSATLMAKCEKDSCLATVDEGLLPSVDEMVASVSASRLCKRPGAQCADSATLLHCSDDMKTATVVVCEDLFPRDAVGAICEPVLEACVVGLEGNGGEYGEDQDAPIPSISPEASLVTKTSQATTPMGTIKFTTKSTETSTVAAKPTQSVYDDEEDRRPSTFSSISFVSTVTQSPNTTLEGIVDTIVIDECRGPGLRCSDGQFLEACEKSKSKPVYKMDCSSVVAHSIDARCEEHSPKEAVCIVSLQKSTLSSDSNNGVTHETEEVFNLELSVVDVTKTSGGSDGDFSAWNCSSVGQYCADDSTLLSCKADYSLEFALSCGAIAPDSVVAYCDYRKNACVVKKINEMTSDTPNKVTQSNETYIIQGTSTQQAEEEASVASVQDDEYNSEAGPDKPQWDFSTISQLYPPEVPQNAYGVAVKPSTPSDLPPTSSSTTEMADTPSLPQFRVCVENGPVCLDDYHLGFCSRELELQYALPCSALYNGNSEAFCDRSLSACLPSSVKLTTTVEPTTTTTTEPPTTTTEAPSTTTRGPFFRPTRPPFLTQQFPSNQNFPPQSIPQPVLQDDVSQPAIVNQPVRPTRPGIFQFFQRPPGNRPGIFQGGQPPRIPGFLQNLIQNFGIRPITQAIRPGLFGSQGSRPSLGALPALGNLFQGGGAVRPLQPLFQGVTPEDVGEEYNFEDPQYVHPGAPTAYSNNPYNRFALLQGQESGKMPVPLINPNFYQEILKHGSALQQTTPHNIFLGLRDQRPASNQPQQSYFDRVLMNIAQNAPTPENVMEASKQNLVLVEPDQKYRPGDSSGQPPSAGMDKVVQATVAPQGAFSPVNPLTWVDKVNFEENKPQKSCKRPGMQCMDSDSLGACSEDLKLQYVIPCKNLLPFIAVGKAFCDEQNDACGVLSMDESPEYPTDYTSYP